MSGKEFKNTIGTSLGRPPRLHDQVRGKLVGHLCDRAGHPGAAVKTFLHRHWWSGQKKLWRLYWKIFSAQFKISERANVYPRPLGWNTFREGSWLLFLREAKSVSPLRPWVGSSLLRTIMLGWKDLAGQTQQLILSGSSMTRKKSLNVDYRSAASGGANFIKLIWHNLCHYFLLSLCWCWHFYVKKSFITLATGNKIKKIIESLHQAIVLFTLIRGH